MTSSARSQRVANLLDRPALIVGFRLERELRERDSLRFGVANGFGEGAIHEHS